MRRTKRSHAISAAQECLERCCSEARPGSVEEPLRSLQMDNRYAMCVASIHHLLCNRISLDHADHYKHVQADASAEGTSRSNHPVTGSVAHTAHASSVRPSPLSKTRLPDFDAHDSHAAFLQELLNPYQHSPTSGSPHWPLSVHASGDFHFQQLMFWLTRYSYEDCNMEWG